MHFETPTYAQGFQPSGISNFTEKTIYEEYDGAGRESIEEG